MLYINTSLLASLGTLNCGQFICFEPLAAFFLNYCVFVEHIDVGYLCAVSTLCPLLQQQGTKNGPNQ